MIDAPRTFDPSALWTEDDPLPTLLRLQEDDPIAWSPRYRAWLVTRYDDVRTGLADPRLTTRRSMTGAKVDPGFARTFADYRKYLDLWLLFRDPPDHTRLRLLTNKAWTPTAIEALRPMISSLVDTLLAGLPETGALDLMTSFSYPLPAEVMAELIGVPRSMLDDLKRWSDGIATSTAASAEDLYRRAANDTVEMAAYIAQVVAERRLNPGDAIIDRLIAAHDGDDRLSHDELVATLIFFLFAGHETTTNLLCNGLRRLLLNPAQLADLRANLDDMAVVRGAVEEILRYEGAVFLSMRVATEDFEWHDRRVRQGDRVYLYQLAANHDPRIFHAPSRFDIRRSDAGRHIAFGYGIHFCLGAPLARLEMEVALPALLRRYPKISLAEPSVEWKNNLILRGPKALNLRLG